MSVYPVGTTIHSPQTGETLTFRSTRESSNGKLFQAELLLEPGTYVSRSHIHPAQEERFVVLEGRFGWRIGNKTGVAGPGETLIAPKGVPHNQWNAGETPVRIYYEHRPALDSTEVFFETQFGLSNEGKLTKSGDFPLLQGAVLLEEVCDFIRPSSPPVWLQKLVFPILVPIGKLMGLRARYARYALKVK
ncbi:MAG: cupin domain-containing protein [Phycisphaerae bacterium]|nr:cupin domain-containing protein [Gemmatimonadaceae bacterium]